MRRVTAGILLGVVAACGAIAWQPSGATDALSWADDRDGALVSRLEALDPRAPMGYFELAEEVVSSFPGSEGYRLARELFALAYALDDQLGGTLNLAPSCALAMAEITSDPDERRWLLTMARSQRETGRARDIEIELPRERLLAAEILALHRGGEYQRLRPMLRRLEFESVLIDAGMARSESLRLVGLVVLDAENSRDEDRTDRRSRSDEEMQPHPRNGGNPGPGLSASDFALSLRGELLLVRGEPGSWAADLAVRAGAPARDLDAGELLSLTGVDAIRSRFDAGAGGWRDGRWVSR